MIIETKTSRGTAVTLSREGRNVTMILTHPTAGEISCKATWDGSALTGHALVGGRHTAITADIPAADYERIAYKPVVERDSESNADRDLRMAWELSADAAEDARDNPSEHSRLRAKADAAKARYLRERGGLSATEKAFRAAESYKHSSNFRKSAAGDRAYKRIENGEDPATVIAQMEEKWTEAALKGADA